MTVASAIVGPALDAAYAAFGTPALYVPPGGGEPLPCRVITPGQDRAAPLESARPIGRGDIVKVRAADVAEPARLGTFGPDLSAPNGITITGTYTINDDPQTLDPERLEWTCRASFKAT